MVMDRRHQEDTSPGALEARDLDHHRQRFDDEHAAHDHQHQFLAHDHRHGAEHRAVAREAVRKSLVLLKNKNQLLPLKGGQHIVVAGDGADNIGKQNGGWTDKFIFPEYEFKICTSLISNFHKPMSTLLMTVAAFGGYDLVMEAYQEAIKEKYRFLTYGDAMLVI